jgi:replicative superfamily II helicase
MSNLYLDLTFKIIEKIAVSSEKIIAAKQEIKFIAEQLRKEQTLDAQVDSAFCYYMAGYYVPAMFLARGIELNKVDSIQKWLLIFIKKDIDALEKSINKTLSNPENTDQCIKDKVERKGLSDIEVVNTVITLKVAEVMTKLLSFIKTGETDGISDGFEILKTCQRLACKATEWALWWRLQYLIIVINEFTENSLWTRLKNFSTDNELSEIVTKYIVANYSRRKVVELWRTQSESLPKINDADRCSFTISVPTSGGKTTVAELTILRFLLDYVEQQEAKCVYIAPFRKLALEVENALSKAFELIDDRLVSAFYGGREIDVFDVQNIEKSRILIVTPEKLDSLLRQYPDLLSQIKVVIADEGHMIGENNNRSFTYRLLLERLIYKLSLQRALDNQKPRIVLISGVLPNVEDFAELISGDRTNVVKIQWRPLGEPEISTWHWTGKELRSYQSPHVASRLITPFIAECSSQDKFEEITAKAAVSFAHTRPTMVFSANAQAIYRNSLLDLLECIAKNLNFDVEPLSKNTPRVKGFEKHYFLLERGIAIHHKKLPRLLKKEVESRIDNNQVQLLFASPTLAQGVNIPFEVIIVYKLQHAPGTPVSPSVFWNVVGRAGRPVIKSNRLDAPEILFFLNLASNSNSHDQRDASISRELINGRTKYQVASPFLDFLLTIKRQWQDVTAKPVAELVANLSERKALKEVVGDLVYSKLEKDGDDLSVDVLIRMFDEHINAIMRENNITDNLISEWLQQSSLDLANLFVKVTNINPEDLAYIKQAVLARITFNARFISDAERQSDYLLGLPVRDCDTIKQNQDSLMDWYKISERIFSNNIDTGVEAFVSILNFVSSLSICKGWYPQKKNTKSNQLSLGLIVPDKSTIARTKLHSKWISGTEINHLLDYLKQLSPNKEFDEYKEDILEGNMAWGISAVCRYLNTVADQRGIPLSKDMDFLPAFVKYGVNTKVGCQLIKLRISRVDAAKISNAYKERLSIAAVADDEIPEFGSDFGEAIKSINIFTNKELRALGVSNDTIKKVVSIRKKFKQAVSNSEVEPPFWEFESIDTN